jgi:hypothetical protein
MFQGNTCAEKKKTSAQRRTLVPQYKETMRFETDFKNKMMQVTVWGDYGKVDKKVFMGIVQIVLDEINIGVAPVVGWYKLYSIGSIISDFSAIACLNDMSGTESGYSITSS